MKCPECGEDLAYDEKCITSNLYSIDDEGVIDDDPTDSITMGIIKSSVYCLNLKCAKEFKHRMCFAALVNEGKSKLLYVEGIE